MDVCIIAVLGAIVATSVVWYLILRNNRKRVQRWLDLPEQIKKKIEEIEV